MVRRIGPARAWPLAAGLAVLAAALAGRAQNQTQPTPATAPDGSRVRVPITTADGVELDGTYFRSPKTGRDCPCIIMVHKFASDRSKSDWINLASALQNEGYAVLTFDLRGHGGSTALSSPNMFWTVPYNRNGIRGSSARKSVISYTDFRPAYFPFIANDVAAARRFFEQKNDAGEVNIHRLVIIGAQEGAGLGFLFTALEYNREYRVGVTALQSNGTSFNAGADIIAGVWLSLSRTLAMPAGNGPNFDLPGWVRQHPTLRDRTPMCFIFGDKDNRARPDSEAVFRVLTGPMSGRPEKHKLDALLAIHGTDLAGAALLGQPALEVPGKVLTFVQKVLADRRVVPWTEVKPEVNVLTLVNLLPFGFRPPG
jgi:pimeloyl-ACP methyl ester carboxylesterase